MLSFLRLAPVPDPKPDTTSAGQITIVLADDHAAMRQSLRTLLDGEVDLRVIGETDSLHSVIRHVHTGRPDVLVLDLGLSSGRSLEMVSELKTKAPDTRIVVLTTNDDPSFAQGVLDSGALGLVLKEMADSDLPAAVRAAWSDQRYVSPCLAARLPTQSTSSGRYRLTPRELEVLRLIALGHTSVEIATSLGLSPRTIETHRARIHRKLGLSTRAELVRYALRHELLRL
jgi:two-component system, NarL family, response regulator NreC